MNAHANGTNALQAIASNAVGAYLGGPILGSGIEVALNGGNRRQIAGAIVGGIVGAVVGDQFGAISGIAAGGCSSALVNRGSCWSGVRDSMIAAGIQAAGTAAYGYLMSGGGGQGAESKRYPPYDAPVGHPTRDADGGSTELFKSCNNGSASSCSSLRAANEASLADAMTFLREKYPDLVGRATAGGLSIQWSDSPDFAARLSGRADSNGITLSSSYRSTQDVVDVLAHEMVHVVEGQLSRVVLVNLWDQGAKLFAWDRNAIGWWHQQHHDFGNRVGQEYFDWKKR